MPVGGRAMPRRRPQRALETRIFGLFLNAARHRDTRPERVPEQADVSAMSFCYDVSAKLSHPTDLRRIC